MALKDIISSAKYADDIVFSLPDGTTATIGEIRALPSEERQQLLQRQQTVSDAEMALARKVQQAVAAGWMTDKGEIVAPAKHTDAELRRAASAETGLDEGDPLLGPVVKEMKAELAKRDTVLKTMQDEFKTSIATITNVVKSAVGANLDERYQSEFSRATKDLPKDIKVEYEGVFNYATENGLKDKFGRLDIARAVKFMTFDDVMKHERKSVREEVSRDLEQRNRVATATRPRTASPEHHREKTDFNPFNEVTDAHGKKVQRAKSFDEALAEAQGDDQLLQSALSTASFGPVQ
jgi:hypothetical protein